MKIHLHTVVLSVFFLCKPIIVLTLVITQKDVSGFQLPASQTSIVFINPSSLNRINEVVSIKRRALGPAQKELLPVIRKGSRTFISQPVDRNQDGNWDELLVEVSLQAGARDTAALQWTRQAQLPQFAAATAVRLSLRSESNFPSKPIVQDVRPRGFTQNIAKPYYQMEGPGIENDKVAFRAFFDSRNGKDVYGKIVDSLVLQRVGVGASWHELQPWGMDILKVGNSLGAGALAIQQNGHIYRLGDADTSIFRSLHAGALEAAFSLDFTNWDVAETKKNGSETLSLTKGAYYYKNDIGLPLNSAQNLIAGFANFGIDKVVHARHNASFSSVSTYGKAEGSNTYLGLAIMFATGDYTQHGTAEPASVIPNTSYVGLKRSSNNKKTIYFFACWEKSDSRFATQQSFHDYIQQTAAALANPVRIQLINKHD